MKNSPPSGVLALMSPLVPLILGTLGLLVSCASNRELQVNRDISSGTHEAGSAFDGDYHSERDLPDNVTISGSSYKKK